MTLICSREKAAACHTRRRGEANDGTHLEVCAQTRLFGAHVRQHLHRGTSPRWIRHEITRSHRCDEGAPAGLGPALQNVRDVDPVQVRCLGQQNWRPVVKIPHNLRFAIGQRQWWPPDLGGGSSRHRTRRTSLWISDVFLTCVPESSSVDVDPNKSLSSPSPRSPIPACSGAKEDRPAKNLPPNFKSLSPPLALPERNSCAAPFCCMSIPAARGARPLCELLEDAAAPLSKGIRDGIGDIKADAWHTARARSAVLSISADPRARASGVAQQLAQPCPSCKRPLQAWISPDTPGTSRHSRSFQYLGDPCQWLGITPPFAPNQPLKTHNNLRTNTAAAGGTSSCSVRT